MEGLHQAAIDGVDDVGAAVVVKLAGELDLYNAHAVRQELERQTSREPQRLVIDLSRLTFIDSTGLGVLIEARSRMKNRSAFVLAAPGLEARRALEISGLDRHLGIHDSVDEALAAHVAD